MPELLREIPNIFLFTNLGSEGDYTRIVFQPILRFMRRAIKIAWFTQWQVC